MRHCINKDKNIASMTLSRVAVVLMNYYVNVVKKREVSAIAFIPSYNPR